MSPFSFPVMDQLINQCLNEMQDDTLPEITAFEIDSNDILSEASSTKISYSNISELVTALQTKLNLENPYTKGNYNTEELFLTDDEIIEIKPYLENYYTKPVIPLIIDLLLKFPKPKRKFSRTIYFLSGRRKSFLKNLLKINPDLKYYQIVLLIMIHMSNPTPTRKEIRQISQELGISETRTNQWFKNKSLKYNPRWCTTTLFLFELWKIPQLKAKAFSSYILRFP